MGHMDDNVIDIVVCGSISIGEASLSRDKRVWRWSRRLSAAGMAGLLISGSLVVGFGAPASAAISYKTITRTSWAYVDSRTPNTSHFNPTGDVPVGKIGGHVHRSFLNFDLDGFHGRQIASATFVAAETQATDCVHRSVELWTTTAATAKSTWKHQPSWKQKLYTVGEFPNTTCPLPYIEWDATAAVRGAVDAGQNRLTLGLRATDESKSTLGRRFATDVKVVITYNTPPDTPTPDGADTVPCATASPYPWLGNLRPTLYARLNDRDGSQDGLLGGTFAVWPVGDPANRRTFPGTSASNGYDSRLTLPEGVVTDGGAYGWSAQATDPQGAISGWSAPCYFQVDAVRPTVAPKVSSTDYPDDGAAHGGTGIPGAFTINANGVDDIVGFSYTWYNAALGTYVAADRPGGSATVTLAPPGFFSTLYVESVDRAGNRSPQVSYAFRTNPTEPIIDASGQPKVGGTLELHFQPGVTLPGYQVVSYTYSVNGGAQKTVAATSDGAATTTIHLVDDANRVTATSTSANGWVSPAGSRSFYADNSPSVASPDFPEHGSGGAVGRPGTFTLSSNLAGSTTFVYWFDDGPQHTAPVGPDGRATISWTPTSAGDQYLYAYSRRADGTESDWYNYAFVVNE